MELKVTKKDLAEVLVEKYGYTKKEANEVVSTVFDEITANLSKGVTTDISGFGKFVVKTRKERTGINPATGQKITISASKAPAFKAAKALKDLFR
ncbi:MAG: HU family DNA-binding protein [Erysipelotrichaceae bacterium]|nr:HU family DNA-binding protein [Erysipelotrichaceae bacterium]